MYGPWLRWDDYDRDEPDGGETRWLDKRSPRMDENLIAAFKAKRQVQKEAKEL